jgi:hypothetical protein
LNLIPLATATSGSKGILLGNMLGTWEIYLKELFGGRFQR